MTSPPRNPGHVRPPSTIEAWVLGVRIGDVHRLIPGAALAAACAALAWWIAEALGMQIVRWQGLASSAAKSPLSPVTIAVVVGMIVANTVGVSASFKPGLDFAVKKLLRAGIILAGVKLSLAEMARGAAHAVPAVVVIITAALLFATWFAHRLGLSARLGYLAAASTAICGVTATLAVAPVIEADDSDVAYTVANVTLFGMIGMLLFPFVAHGVFGGATAAASQQAGLFLGTSVHDTSQVIGAALSYGQMFSDDVAAKAATVTKLTRNCFLVAVVPLLGFLNARRAGSTGKRPQLSKLFPLFVLGFVIMAVLRTVGDHALAGGGLAFGYWAPKEWKTLVDTTLGHQCATALLAAAMGGVGFTTRWSTLRGMGLKPLWLGAASAILVASLGLGLAAVL